MSQTLRPPLPDADNQKFVEKLVSKLKYCRDVVVSIVQSTAKAAATNTTISAQRPESAGFAAGVMEGKEAGSRAGLR